MTSKLQPGDLIRLAFSNARIWAGSWSGGVCRKQPLSCVCVCVFGLVFLLITYTVGVLDDSPEESPDLLLVSSNNFD